MLFSQAADNEHLIVSKFVLNKPLSDEQSLQTFIEKYFTHERI